MYEFQQVDLAAQRVVILDTSNEVYVWVGLKSPEKEKKRGKLMTCEERAGRAVFARYALHDVY